MKRKVSAKKLLALFLSIMLFATAVPVALISAQNDSEAGFTDISLTLEESYEGAAYWVIELTSDKEIGFGNNSYWYRNLQQIADAAGEEHNALAQILRDNILINGKSIDAGLNESTDKATSTRIKVGCTDNSTQNKLYIAVIAEFVGQKDNVYGVNDYTEFTLEFKEGITLNSHSIKPVKYRYSPYDQTFKIDDGTRDFVEAKFETVDNYENDTYYLITLKSETNIGFGDNSYWYCNLQQISDEADEAHNELAQILRDNILINGKSVGSALNEAEDKETSTRIKIGCESEENESNLYIAVKCSDNQYAISADSDFKLEIKEGITLNGKKMSASAFIYYADLGKMVYRDPDTPDYVDDPNGATIQSVTMQMGNASCGDHLSGQSYFIRINTDKTLYDSGLNSASFYNRHLQCCAQDGINEMILSKIRINGKALKDCATDYWKAFHVKASAQMLEIEIPVDNDFGFKGYGDFTVEIDQGITLNNLVINPRIITYTANTGDGVFKIEKLIDDTVVIDPPQEITVPDYDGGATIKNVSVTKISSPSCSSHNTGAAWIIKLETDKDFGSNNSYWWRHLQADKGNYANGSDLLNNIQLNGKTLTACKGSADVFKFLHIKVGQGSKIIEIEIPANNTYGFNGDGDFTLEIGRGVTVNGISVNPRKITWDADATPKFKIEKIIEEVDNTLPDNSEYAIINNVSITKISAPSCASHNTGAAWVIKLDTDKDFGSDNSYWWRHLQANDSTFSDGADLRSKIKLNGKTLEECLGGGSDYTFLHIRVGQGSKTVEIEIPANNKYGFNGDGDFTLQILEGAKINNIGINPRNITYTAKIGTGTFKVEEFNAVDDDSANVATISNASIVNVSSPSCSSHNTGAAWVIKLETDKDFGSDNSYWWRHLQAASGDGKPANREDLLNNIKLNGNTLTQCMGESDVYGFLHIRVGAGSKTIEIEIPANNTYGFNGAEDFTLDILDGVTVNGFRLSPKTIKYTASDNQFTVEDYAPQLKYTTIAEAELTTESVTVGDESVEKFWLIKLKTGEDITVSGDLSKDLQFVERQRTQERKLLAKELINNITVNGETLAESMERAGTHYTARVSIVGNEIILKLNKKTSSTVDNDFHISNEEDFTVCLRENIIVSGVEIASARFRYDSALGKFVADDGEDVKNIAEAKLKITGATVFENGKGITLWPSGTSRYVDVLLDGKVTEDSKNSEALANEHGEQSRNYIYVDGLSISEWIGYGEGDLYQVMVRFEGNIIRFLFDGSREPGMTDDEVHWIEFKDGLYSASGEKIMPCKLYYTPATGVWEIVDSFDGLEKPWTLTNFEKKTAEAVKGPKTDPSYVLNWYDNDETVISQKLIEYEKALEEINNNSQNSAIEGATNTGDDNTEKIVDNEKVTVKKKYKTPVVYEDYVPVWAIVLIVAGVVLAAGAVCFIVIRKKRKANKI